MFKPKGAQCQSCGMPVGKKGIPLGTNKDGEKDGNWCIECYKDGEFTEPEITLDEMLNKSKCMMKDASILSFVANDILASIPKLKRWSDEPLYKI